MMQKKEKKRRKQSTPERAKTVYNKKRSRRRKDLAYYSLTLNLRIAIMSKSQLYAARRISRAGREETNRGRWNGWNGWKWLDLPFSSKRMDYVFFSHDRRS